MDSTVLDGFKTEELDDLKRIIECHSFVKGDFILRQDQQATNLYIVLSGEVEILHKPYDGPILLVSKLTSGGVFGWSSILSRRIYTSSAMVSADCTIYCISGHKLQQFCELHHETGVVLLEKIAMSVAPQANIHKQITSMLHHAMSCGDDLNIKEAR